MGAYHTDKSMFWPVSLLKHLSISNVYVLCCILPPPPQQAVCCAHPSDITWCT
jgi:hypothetical protein